MAKTPSETQAVAAIIFSIGQIDTNGSIESKEFHGDYLATLEFREPITHAIFERNAPARQRFRLIHHVIVWNDQPLRRDFVAVANYYERMGVTIHNQTCYPNVELHAQALRASVVIDV